MESAPARAFIPVRIRGLLIGLAAAGFLSVPSFPDTTPFSGTVSVWASGHAAKHPDPVDLQPVHRPDHQDFGPSAPAIADGIRSFL